MARIFNTYGPRMHPDDGRVVSNFIVRALRDDPIPIYGDGTQTRSFCFVEDMIDGLVRMMEGPDEFIGPVNLGNPVEHTMLELAEKVLARVGRQQGISFQPLPQDVHLFARLADRRKAIDALGDAAVDVLLAEGLAGSAKHHNFVGF